jgi:hypothetical protein
LRLKGRGDHERKGDRQSKDLTEEEMQVGDSGMPDEAYWSSLFDMAGIVDSDLAVQPSPGLMRRAQFALTKQIKSLDQAKVLSERGAARVKNPAQVVQ